MKFPFINAKAVANEQPQLNCLSHKFNGYFAHKKKVKKKKKKKKRKSLRVPSFSLAFNVIKWCSSSLLVANSTDIYVLNKMNVPN